MRPQLSIVIVNWNGGALLRDCLASLRRYPPHLPYEVIVVDNASTDASAAWLESEEALSLFAPGQLRVIANADNLGFSKANNQAFAASDAPLVLLLNPDTEVRAGTVNALIAGVRSDERIAACGPRQINSDGSLQPTVWHNPPAAWEILLSGTKLYRLLPSRARGELLLGPHWDHARRRFVRRLSGAAMLVRREIIEEVGGLDERFYMYGEDLEWCLRMVRRGYLLLFEPAAVVLHHCSKSSVQRWGNLETLRRVTDGQLRFQRYTLPRRRLIGNVLACSVVGLASYARRTLAGQPTAELRMQLALYAAYLKRALGGGYYEP